MPYVLGWAYPAKTGVIYRYLWFPVPAGQNHSTSTIYVGYKLGNTFVFVVCFASCICFLICLVDFDVVPTTGCHEMETILTESTTFTFHDKLKGIIVDKFNRKNTQLVEDVFVCNKTYLYISFPNYILLCYSIFFAVFLHFY